LDACRFCNQTGEYRDFCVSRLKIRAFGSVIDSECGFFFGLNFRCKHIFFYIFLHFLELFFKKIKHLACQEQRFRHNVQSRCQTCSDYRAGYGTDR